MAVSWGRKKKQRNAESERESEVRSIVIDPKTVKLQCKVCGVSMMYHTHMDMDGIKSVRCPHDGSALKATVVSTESQWMKQHALA